MRVKSMAFAACLGASSLIAQSPGPSPEAHPSDLGYTYSLPRDWAVVNANSTLPGVKEQAQQNASSDEEKKGVACVQIALTARHGDPASVFVVVELPFACFGQSISAKDLPGF